MDAEVKLQQHATTEQIELSDRLRSGDDPMERLVGKKIIEVRQMTEEEVEYEGWPGAGDDTVLVLDDGTRVYASCDPEGNMPGALFVREPDKVVYRGNVYLALDEDDLCGSLEFIECAAAEA